LQGGGSGFESPWLHIFHQLRDSGHIVPAQG
jgi:hypothetical protein